MRSPMQPRNRITALRHIRAESAECGDSFVPKMSTQVVCSPVCRRNRDNRLKRRLEGVVYSCEECLQSFRPIRRGQAVCSRECRRGKDAKRVLAQSHQREEKERRRLYDVAYNQRPEVQLRRRERQAKTRDIATNIERRQRYAASERGQALHRRSQSKRRAALRTDAVEQVPTVTELLARQGGKCANCRVQPNGSVHVDHIMPLALGGPHATGNVQALCQPCNQRKYSKHPLVFAREEGRLL